MKIWALLTLVLILPAVTAGRGLVHRPDERFLTAVDLDADGQQERVFVSAKGVVRVVGPSGADLFAFPLPSESPVQVEAEVYPIPDGRSLLWIHWPWCPRDYPDNLIIWYDPAAGRIITDRQPDALMDRCGLFEYEGEGRFRTQFRMEEFAYTRHLRWQDDHLEMESTEVELLAVRLDRLPDVLGMLSEQDVDSPGALFETRALYEEFKARVGPGWRFAPLSSADGEISLRVTGGGRDQGTLTITYAEADPSGAITITGLRWSP